MRVITGLPDDWNPETIGRAVGAGFSADRPRAVRVSFLDTFDWRLAAAGGRLSVEADGGGRVLRWQDAPDAAPQVIPIRSPIQFARELPESVVRGRLEQLTGVRALLVVGEANTERWSGRVRDRVGNTSALLVFETAVALDSTGAPVGEPVSRAEVQGIPGCETAFEEIVSRLAAGADGTSPDLLELAALARGRRVGDYSSKLDLRLAPEQPADAAVRAVLRRLLQTLKENVEGVIADHDTEFLHDLRVATRRTRAVLTQLKGALPEEETAPYRGEFRWLGSLTGPCRDLDVFLLEMATFRGLLDEPPATLDPLERVVRRARTSALRDVRKGLRSARFRRLVEGWESYLASAVPDERSGAAVQPIHELASLKILKAYRRTAKRVRRLGDAPCADELHRLRIEGKKLRYLLEFFRSLFATDDVEPLIKDLKQVQDLLGSVNDLRVQQHRLVDLARELARSNDVEAILAMGRLSGKLRQREEQLRLASFEVVAGLGSPESRSRFGKLFGRTTT